MDGKFIFGLVIVGIIFTLIINGIKRFVCKMKGKKWKDIKPEANPVNGRASKSGKVDNIIWNAEGHFEKWHLSVFLKSRNSRAGIIIEFINSWEKLLSLRDSIIEQMKIAGDIAKWVDMTPPNSIMEYGKKIFIDKDIELNILNNKGLWKIYIFKKGFIRKPLYKGEAKSYTEIIEKKNMVLGQKSIKGIEEENKIFRTNIKFEEEINDIKEILKESDNFNIKLLRYRTFPDEGFVYSGKLSAKVIHKLGFSEREAIKIISNLPLILKKNVSKEEAISLYNKLKGRFEVKVITSNSNK